jgi:hypothetical protein
MHYINPSDLQATPSGFFRIFELYRKEGMTMQNAYYCTVNHFEDIGYTVPYTCFESLKNAYCRQLRKELGKV